MPFATRLRGPLQLDALQKALLALTERHETLRTTFDHQDGVGVQVVHPFQPKSLNVIDMSSPTDADLLRALHREHATVFDLSTAPGWRPSVFRLGPEDHVLSIVMHHIVSDGWSVNVLRKELMALLAELLCDKPRPTSLSGQAGRQEISIEDSLYKGLQQFCAERQVTPFIVLLAVFRLAHYHLTGVSDATIGTPVANRSRQELEDLIGFFVNVQCIRITIDDEPFQGLVRQVRGTTSAAFASQDVPFEDIVSHLEKRRDLSRNPLVQLAFAVHSQAEFGQFELEGLQAEQINVVPTTRFDLELHLFQGEGALQGHALYAKELFDHETIRLFLAVFRDLLQQGLAQPETTARGLPLADGYPALDRMGLIRIDRTDYPRDCSVVEVFQQQVQAGPARVAVQDASAQLTYLELDQRSDRLARWLAGRGFPAETLVGVAASRSRETIVAFLAILKAHLAYLPLDVKVPAGRIDAILASVPSCRLVLLGSDVKAPAVHRDGVEFVCVPGQDHQAPDGLHGTPAIAPPHPESLAYVMFTSGSTGRPKGVMIEHRGIIRLARSNGTLLCSPSDYRIAHMANLTFDISTWEIYTALLNGGTLVCIDDMAVLNAIRLNEVFSTAGVHAAMFTPALLKSCLDEHPQTLRNLGLLMVAGDRSNPEDLAIAQGLVEGGAVVNTTIYRVPRGVRCANGVPIGRALTDSGAYVMDSNLRLVPLGVMGELVVTGDGLARGYTDTQLDQGRFVTVDIGGQRTRYRPTDGQLECSGRMDQQVKIRGYRVELAEIEHVLLAHSSVSDAVAVIQQQEDGGSSILGFVTVHEPQAPVSGVAPADENTAEQVRSWTELFIVEKYGAMPKLEPDTVGRDFVGWTSIYDGSNIVTAEMNEWLDDTIDTILSSGPHDTVLEVGTGSGMVLFNLIPHFKRYVGLEPASNAVHLVNAAVRSIPGAAEKIQMQVGTAADICHIQSDQSHDLAILNSVIQSFPSPGYLMKVIKDLVQLQGVKRIFLGDIRSYALYGELQVSKVLHRLGDAATVDDVQQAIAEAPGLEEELLVDPAFFTRLPVQLPDLVEHVEILPKKMEATNELSCYRYAAVLHARQDKNPPIQIHEVGESDWVDCMDAALDHRSLLKLLQKSAQSSLVAVSNIPYKKTILERQVLDLLDDKCVRALAARNHRLQTLRRMDEPQPSLSPVELVALARKTGFEVEISWARQHSQRGGLDAIFHRNHAKSKTGRVLFRFPTDHAGRPSRSLSNHPLQQRYNQRTQRELRQMLQARLPQYMVPQSIVVVDKMPINNNGKVDRQALAKQAHMCARSKVIPDKIAPGSDTEHALAQVISDILGIEIGITDNFFDYGGDSLKATKVVTRINSQLDSAITVRDLFQHSTVASLAQEMQTSLLSSPMLQHRDFPPFSLLDYDASSLTPAELGELGLTSTGAILEILPLTGCQLWFLTQWTPVTTSFTINGPMDPDRLQATCRAVVQKHSILRTVFTRLRDKLVQVILRSFEAFSHRVAAAAQNASDAPHCPNLPHYDLSNLDRPNPLALGKPPTRFTLFSQSPTQHLFVIQLWHAQYDGLSLPFLSSDLTHAYNAGGVLPSTPATPFAQYVYGRHKHRSAAAFTFWRHYLRGARMTTLPGTTTAPEDSSSSSATDTKETATGALPPTNLPGITLPTLMNAALAYTLAHHTQSSDITFGPVMDTRANPVQDATTILGPCININPVRVQLPPPPPLEAGQSWTARELCHALHEQYVQIARYSVLDLDEITARSTDWAPGTRFGCIFNHLPREDYPPLAFDGAHTAFRSAHLRICLPGQVLVRCITVGGGELKVQVLASGDVWDGKGAAALARMLLETGQRVARFPDALALLSAPRFVE
ncbi:acetyl-CoA synthetase-like protein [Aspergillus japonicus CBS 114.51]|uniref:Acetyl-CoA synthetase-like protein n=1 Tax=Aspergillus japonicus CBS 114.51 TaxID=1448312 RepID=A0A8T8WLZ7_ASPJA|nr:acetyl-CoA synthetase-like protein [Aspergillus japonicus CBS 114.51]RAH76885.1 acetyl-CoA synthetase-like protein [Aspergillus japonicus CBS 114.51]